MRHAPLAVSLALNVAVLALAGAARADDAPTPPPPGTVRIVAGGNSHLDDRHVLPWAFDQARELGASAFVFLGDMELRPTQDGTFEQELGSLGSVPFYPVIGNHELRDFGALGRDGDRKLQRAYQARFLGNARTPVASAFANKSVYSVDLAGGIHLLSLDNVSQAGFGADQLAWLERDLAAARANPATRHVIVAVHEPLAKNPVTTHGMDEDGADAARDSDAALALFQRYGVELILQAHLHEFASYTQGGIASFISGGLGSPLPDAGPARVYAPDADPTRHHFLVIDVTDDAITVRRVDFPAGACAPTTGDAGLPPPTATGPARALEDVARIGHHVGEGFLHGSVLGAIGAAIDDVQRFWRAAQSSLPPDAELDGPVGGAGCPGEAPSAGFVRTIEASGRGAR